MGMSIEEYRKIVLKDRDLKPKKLNRQLQGQINRGLGKNFEEEIEGICEFYRRNHLALIEKTPEPMKILKHIENGHFETVFTKSAQPDFKGTLKGGQTVVFDAKFTESNKITYQALSDFQRETLLAYRELGAKAFVLVGFADGAIYPIDIKIWSKMQNVFGHKHIKQVELENGEFRAKPKKGIIDFLGMMEGGKNE